MGLIARVGIAVAPVLLFIERRMKMKLCKFCFALCVIAGVAVLAFALRDQIVEMGEMLYDFAKNC